MSGRHLSSVHETAATATQALAMAHKHGNPGLCPFIPRPSPCWETRSGSQRILAQAGRGVKSHITAGYALLTAGTCPTASAPRVPPGICRRETSGARGKPTDTTNGKVPGGQVPPEILYTRAWDCSQSERATGWPPRATGSTGVGSQQRQQTSRHGRRCPAVGPGPCRRSRPPGLPMAR